MINFIRKYFTTLIIIVLIILLFMNRCDKPYIAPEYKIDTVFSQHVDTVPGKPRLYYTEADTIYEPSYLPDTNYQKLKKQYQDLLMLYFAKNYFKDTLVVDTLGKVFVTDKISKNTIIDRQYNYSFKYPTAIQTTIYPTPRNQIYVGGGISGNLSGVNQITGGILLKNKKDQIFELHTGINQDAKFVFGASSYWKIKFK